MIELNETAIRGHCRRRKEPAWLLARRLQALRIFFRSKIRAPNFRARPEENAARGIAKKRGVGFLQIDEALRRHPEIVRKYFGAAVADDDNPYAALNAAIWSRGAFLYVPKGTAVASPLETDRFERTLIVAGEGARVDCLEGCSTPRFPGEMLHIPVVEIIALKGAEVRFMTLQNWPSTLLNFVTKKAVAHADARVQWLDGNVGSKRTVKRPAVILAGRGARGEILSVGLAGPGQSLELGGALVFKAAGASGEVIIRCASFGGGRVHPRISVSGGGRSKTSSQILKLDGGGAVQKRLSFLRSRGVIAAEAQALLTNGFFSIFSKQLPLEFSVEFNRLVQLEFEAAAAKLD